MRAAVLAALAVAAGAPAWADDRDKLVGSWRCLDKTRWNNPELGAATLLNFDADGGLTFAIESWEGSGAPRSATENRREGKWDLRLSFLRMDLGQGRYVRIVKDGVEAPADVLDAVSQQTASEWKPMVTFARVRKIQENRLELKVGDLDLECQRRAGGA